MKYHCNDRLPQLPECKLGVIDLVAHVIGDGGLPVVILMANLVFPELAIFYVHPGLL